MHSRLKVISKCKMAESSSSAASSSSSRGATHHDWLKTVNKLKGKLRDATTSNHGYEENAVRKILTKLDSVPMTLELLQVTHIGKEVNGLRKFEGDVGRTAKHLVKSWKQLLAAEEGGQEGGGRRRGGDEGGRGGRGGDERDRGGGDEGGRGGGGGGSRERRRREKESRSPAPPPLPSSSSSSSSSNLAPPPSYHTSSRSLSPVSTRGGGGIEERWSPSPNHSRLSLSPSRGILPSPAGLGKRKAPPVVQSEDAIALSKRSRTQVYSGKKTSGPQAVVSLFDLSMRVLMDNIDAIEEVGGVPYLILEPLLQKCTASQLLRLEEFNPHFLEDSDVLWRKHCERDFKGARLPSQHSWRELYLSKLSDREERLKNITANIRKREEARKEPVRQVKLAAATRAPGRRRQVSSVPLPSRPSLLNRPSQQFRGPPPNASKLKRQTMKMIKERSLMTMSRPPKR